MERGRGYLIFTVQFFYSGRVVGFDSGAIVLADARQIFDTGDLRNTVESMAWQDARPCPNGVSIPMAMITGWEPLPQLDEGRNGGKATKKRTKVAR